jgi:hypothetical protein
MTHKLEDSSVLIHIFNTQSYNRYSYTINNPLKYTDPDGNFFLAFLAAAITKTIVTNKAVYAMRSTMLPCPPVMVSIEPRLS